MDTSEQEIIKFISQGQQSIRAAIALLMQQYEKQVNDFCYYSLKDASKARETTSKAFLSLPNALFKYDISNHTSRRMFILIERIAHELCMAQKPALQFEEWEDDEDKQKARNELSEKDRVILYLRSLKLKWREIGSILGISMSAAQKRGQRAEERLAEIKNVQIKF